METRKALLSLKRSINSTYGSRLRITGPQFSVVKETWFLLLSSPSSVLSFLPAFHVVLTETSCSLIAYNGKELRREEGTMLIESQLIQMLANDELQMCRGLQLLKHEHSAIELDHLRESMDDQIVVRSPQCQYFVEDGGAACSSCLDQGQPSLVDMNGDVDGEEHIEEAIKNEFNDDDHDISNLNDFEQVIHEDDDDVFPLDKKTRGLARSRGGRSTAGRRSTAPRKRTSPQGGFSGSCPLCFTHFTRERLYTRHMDVHRSRQSDLDQPIQCPLCGLQVEDKYKINEHMTTTHDPKEGLCVLCLKMMPVVDLKKHYLHSHHHKCKHHLCQLCGESFTSSVNMKVHMSEVHNQGDVEKKVCDHCGKVFPHKTRLSDHIYKHHNSRTFKCATCDKSFATPMAYYKHVRTHSNVKPFVCSQCGYRALRKDNVKQHVRNVHKLEDPGSYVRRDGDFDHNKDNTYILANNKAPSKVEEQQQTLVNCLNNNDDNKISESSLIPSHHVQLAQVNPNEDVLKATTTVLHIMHPMQPHGGEVHITTTDPPSIVQAPHTSNTFM